MNITFVFLKTKTKRNKLGMKEIKLEFMNCLNIT